MDNSTREPDSADQYQAVAGSRLRRFWRTVLGIVTLGLVSLGVLVVVQIATWPDVGRLSRDAPGKTAFMLRYVERQRGAGGDTTIAQTWVPYHQISPHLKAAILVGEDIEFFDHNGFSVSELKAALEDAWREREAPRGASTLTQQLAKNLWLSPSRNPLRKIKEAILVTQLEDRLGKERLFELYLNVAEFGPGIYGAEAAARHYFGKPALQLTRREGAMLAAGLPRPSSWNPSTTSSTYQRRVGQLEDRIAFHRDYLERRLNLPPAVPTLDSALLDAISTIPAVPDTIPAPRDTTRTR